MAYSKHAAFLYRRDVIFLTSFVSVYLLVCQSETCMVGNMMV